MISVRFGISSLAAFLFFLAATDRTMLASTYTATFTGPSGGNWSAASNWSGGMAPVDSGSNTFSVTIPDSTTVIFDPPGATTVDSLNLSGYGSALTLNIANSLSVTSSFTDHGTMTLSAGSVNAGSGTSGSIDNARILASAGSTFTTPLSISSYTMNINDGNSYTLFSAAGTGTVLNASALQSLTMGYNYGTISASGGGLVNLSGLQSINMTDNNGRYLSINSSTGGRVDLSTLTSITSAGDYVTISSDSSAMSLPQLTTAQITSLNPANGSTLSLPQLTTFTNGWITAAVGTTVLAPSATSIGGTALTLSGGTFIAPALTNVDRAQLVLGGQSVYTLPSAISSYTMNFNNGNSYTLFSAAGTGTVLNASALQSLTMGYNYGTISASGGGLVNLSGLQSINMTDNNGRYLSINSSTGGRVDLSNLTSITSAGDYVTISSDSSAMSLPQLTTAQNTYFNPANGGTLSLPNLVTSTGGGISAGSNTLVSLPKLTNFSNGSITAGVGTTVLAPSAASIGGTAITLSGGTFVDPALASFDRAQFLLSAAGNITLPSSVNSYTMNFNNGNSYTLFSAAGAGTVLNASALQSLTMGYNYGTISASGGGLVNLSGLQSINMTDNNGRYLSINSSTGGRVDLSNLTSITSAGDYVSFNVSGGTMNIGNLNAVVPANISVSGLGSQLNVSRNVLLGPSSSLAVGSGGNLVVGGNFQYQTTSASALSLAGASVQFDGGGVQELEVGGADKGNGNPSSSDFGFGQLVVGQPSKPAVVDLEDAINNGNRGTGGTPEALYLFGLGGPNGLVLQGGSVLQIHNLNVYSMQSGVWTSLQSLFPTSQNIIPYGGGFISRSMSAMPGSWNVDASGNWSSDPNWLLTAPNGVDAAAVFSGVITAPRTVTVDVPVNIGSITFSSSQSYTIAGTQPINLAVSGTGDATIESSGTANETISARVNLLSNTDISTSGSGTLYLNGYLGNPFGERLTTEGNVVIAGTTDFAIGSALSVCGGTTQLFADLGGGTEIDVGTDRTNLIIGGRDVLIVRESQDCSALIVGAGGKLIFDSTASASPVEAAEITAVPEPSTLALLATCAIGVLGFGLRRRASANRSAHP